MTILHALMVDLKGVIYDQVVVFMSHDLGKHMRAREKQPHETCADLRTYQFFFAGGDFMESSCAELIILSEFCHRTLRSCTCWATTRFNT